MKKTVRDQIQAALDEVRVRFDVAVLEAEITETGGCGKIPFVAISPEARVIVEAEFGSGADMLAACLDPRRPPGQFRRAVFEAIHKAGLAPSEGVAVAIFRAGKIPVVVDTRSSPAPSVVAEALFETARQGRARGGESLPAGQSPKEIMERAMQQIASAEAPPALVESTWVAIRELLTSVPKEVREGKERSEAYDPMARAMGFLSAQDQISWAVRWEARLALLRKAEPS